MEGKYVNFGVMDFYGDTTLHNTLDGVFRLGLSIPFADMLKFAKVKYDHVANILEVMVLFVP